MMKELSMHILDIANNSVRAEAKHVTITIHISTIQDLLTIIIEDDGIGMEEDFLIAIKNPFTTTRTLRKVGLGIPMLNDTCHQCNGHLDIVSKKGQGTTVTAVMGYTHIDRPPMGSIAITIAGLITSNPSININYRHIFNQEVFSISTKDIVDTLDNEIPITHHRIYQWLTDYINENISALH